jgi:protein TonB
VTAEAPKEVPGFQELAMPTMVLTEIPPPPALGTVSISALDFTGEGAVGGRGGLAQTEPAPMPSDAAPAFTPFTVAPFLKNAREVTRTLEREYPPQLRAAAIGGRVLLWIFIDDRGTVEETLVKTSSGFAALDAAAMRVALTMEFSPAVNRDRKVPVWVAMPVDFAVQ